MAAATGSLASAITKATPLVPKTAELQILGLTQIYINDQKGPYAFFEFESVRKAFENFSIFCISHGSDWNTYISKCRGPKTTPPQFDRFSAFDLFKNDVGPKVAKYGFGLVVNPRLDKIGQPIKTAEDIIKCVGLAIKTGGVIKSIPVIVISQDELIPDHDGFDSGRFYKREDKEKKN